MLRRNIWNSVTAAFCPAGWNLGTHRNSETHQRASPVAYCSQKRTQWFRPMLQHDEFKGVQLLSSRN
jgi:hypothetical protein